MDDRAWDALIDLVSKWSNWDLSRDWYLSTLIPEIIHRRTSADLSESERETIATLEDLLDAEEWSQLATHVLHARELISQRELDRRAEIDREADAANARRSAEAEAANARRAAAAEAAKTRQEAEAQSRHIRAHVLEGLQQVLRDDFLGARAWWDSGARAAGLPDQEFEAAASAFVKEWFSTEVVDWIPSDEQARAIAHVDGHALVSARAGSGKTATIVARAVFLIRHCGVDPREFLILAFNKKAATEVHRRVTVMLRGAEPPHVMTFHALAYRLVHPEETLVYDEDENRRAQSRIIRQSVDHHVKDPAWQDKIRRAMTGYFCGEWDAILDRGDHLAPSDQVAYRRGLRRESLRGEFVKSYGERLIANTLFEWDVDYGYEFNRMWNGTNYRPDFTVLVDRQPKAVIEYFGLLGDADYDADAHEKRKYWATQAIPLLEYGRHDVADPAFRRRLLNDLTKIGIPSRHLSDEEVWRRIKVRAIGRFEDAMKTLVDRARQRRWDGTQLRTEWSEFANPVDDLDVFVDVAAAVLDDYPRRLRASKSEDFVGLLWQGVTCIEKGRTEFGRKGRIVGDVAALSFVLIDEFQDFSPMFFELVQGILDAADGAKVTAVGDDWQAINEFAGSTLEFFETFEQGFPGASRVAISTNRRSTSEIVGIGNTLMVGRGTPAAHLMSGTSQIREFDLPSFVPSALEQQRFGDYDSETPAILRVITSHLAASRSVAVLSRTKAGRDLSIDGEIRHAGDIEEYGAIVRELLGVEDPSTVSFSTTHGFKGEEADAVLLLSVTGRNYPLIHPTWPLFQVFGDTVPRLTEAERRLFYVAISRPHTHLDVFVDPSDLCEFWEIAKQGAPVEIYPLDLLVESHSSGGLDRVEVRISGWETNHIKSELQRDGYAYRGKPDFYWVQVVDRRRYSDGALISRPWWRPGIRAETWHEGRLIFEHGAAAVVRADSTRDLPTPPF